MGLGIATIGSPLAPGEPSAAPPRQSVTGLIDRYWTILFVVLVLALSGVPNLVAATRSPGQWEHLGTLWFGRDVGQYLAAMRDGGKSVGWLIFDRYSVEPHAPAAMYPLYVGLGKLAAQTGVDTRTVFSVAEWLGRVALLAGLVGFATVFLPSTKPRRLALMLSVATLGLTGWALIPAIVDRLVGNGGSVTSTALPAINPYLEFNTLGVFFAAPHIMLGLAITLACAPLYVLAAAGRGVALAALAMATGLLSVLHPFNLPVVFSVLGTDALLRLRSSHSGGMSRRLLPLLTVVMALATALPFTLYTVLLVNRDPFWSATYSGQNLMLAPHPWALPVDMGIVLLAAPFAWARMRTWPVNSRRLLLLWVALGLLWMYLPVPYQRRFAFGVQPGLAVMAAVGLLWINERMRAHEWGAIRRRIVNYGIALGALATSVLSYLALLTSTGFNIPLQPYLFKTPELASAQWLGLHSTPDDVALASPNVSNSLISVFDGRVVYGHPVATLNATAKESAVRRFYAADTPSYERSRLLQETGATLVALGPRERQLGAADLAGQLELELVYDEQGVRWYRVRTP